MKHRIVLAATTGILLFMTGCLRTYSPSIYEPATTPMIFVPGNDSRNHNLYLNSDITISDGQYGGEAARLLRGSLIFAKITNHSNINVRLFGFGGYYRVSGLEKFDGMKNTLGLGGEMGFSTNFKIKSTKFGYGISGGMGSEFGEYRDFKQKAGDENVIDDSSTPYFFLFSLFPFVTYEFSDDTNLTCQLNMGNQGIFAPNLTFINDGYVYWITVMPGRRSDARDVGLNVSAGFMFDLNKIGIKL